MNWSLLYGSNIMLGGGGDLNSGPSQIAQVCQCPWLNVDSPLTKQVLLVNRTGSLGQDPNFFKQVFLTTCWSKVRRFKSAYNLDKIQIFIQPWPCSNLHLTKDVSNHFPAAIQYKQLSITIWYLWKRCLHRWIPAPSPEDFLLRSHGNGQCSSSFPGRTAGSRSCTSLVCYGTVQPCSSTEPPPPHQYTNERNK